jgi:dsDNA-specific endonuclease/ATPase MutS2
MPGNKFRKNGWITPINAAIGMLIPVHERTETFLFDRILTDIGDNLLKII